MKILNGHEWSWLDGLGAFVTVAGGILTIIGGFVGKVQTDRKIDKAVMEALTKKLSD